LRVCIVPRLSEGWTFVPCTCGHGHQLALCLVNHGVERRADLVDDLRHDAFLLSHQAVEQVDGFNGAVVVLQRKVLTVDKRFLRFGCETV
jgi:hypothetical protein